MFYLYSFFRFVVFYLGLTCVLIAIRATSFAATPVLYTRLVDLLPQSSDTALIGNCIQNNVVSKKVRLYGKPGISYTWKTLCDPIKMSVSFRKHEPQPIGSIKLSEFVKYSCHFPQNGKVYVIDVDVAYGNSVSISSPYCSG